MAAEKKVTVGVIVNGSKPGAKEVIYQVAEFAESHPGLKLLFEKRTGRLIKRSGLTETALAKRSDVLLVAGGDGSLIDVVNAVYPSQTPILGVNIGSLGFLTAVAATEVEKVLPYLASMDLLLSPRLVLETTINHASGKRQVVPCNLNDIVVTRMAASRLARIRVEIGDALVTEYVCDGLIISTPTGSTAYNLASNGPILSPTADAIVLTPICPHTLTNRALVVGTDQPIRVRVVRQPGVPPPGVQFDGRDGGSLRPHDWLEIKPARAKVQLAYLPHTDFYRVLRQKLKWSGASV
ncbi:MAG TPA: NAD(+)/NADH kinase [Candidatus Methylacidiphilales bacterium]|nr:NAD(+)/NADH kinase [Candidatus Methylacidiphilales bacterium]